MTETKFRCWDKEAEIMYEPFGLADLFGCNIAYPQLKEKNEEGDWVVAKHIVVMQYTGLKDKNGKEIYEGDVVEFAGYKKDYVQVIAWDNMLLHTSFGGGTHNAMIIANVYENPNFLSVD